MKLRYKAPAGGGTLDLDDSATVGELLAAIRLATGHDDVTVKYGWPPRALSGAQQGAESCQSLGLQRESLTVVPAEGASMATAAAAPAASSAGAAAPSSSSNAPKKSSGVEDQGVSVKIPENGSELVLRVMPDDNSCLFTAVGGALRGLPPSSPKEYTPETLRRLVVEHIRSNPAKYTKVVLEAEPAAYCARMLRRDTWGGAIELGIISEVFELEICSVDVKTNNVYRYGEGSGYRQRCILVYSNIHYDRIAESLVPGSADADFEVVRWDVEGSEGHLEKARELCRILREEHHYFTDTSEFVVSCNECGWVGQGEKQVAMHATKTGHTDISEIADSGI
ncbi:ubiquitin thioesterase OTU1 [Microdochium nivale]|nr:ubiquitin thioesterase OTU1 [Microdochium nivale]